MATMLDSVGLKSGFGLIFKPQSLNLLNSLNSLKIVASQL